MKGGWKLGAGKQQMSVAIRMRADQRMFGLSSLLIEPWAQKGVHGPREARRVTCDHTVGTITKTGR